MPLFSGKLDCKKQFWNIWMCQHNFKSYLFTDLGSIHNPTGLKEVVSVSYCAHHYSTFNGQHLLSTCCIPGSTLSTLAILTLIFTSHLWAKYFEYFRDEETDSERLFTCSSPHSNDYQTRGVLSFLAVFKRESRKLSPVCRCHGFKTKRSIKHSNLKELILWWKII